jgi:hypothetical protein
MTKRFVCAFCKKAFYVESYVTMDIKNNYYCTKCSLKTFDPNRRRWKAYIRNDEEEKKE